MANKPLSRRQAEALQFIKSFVAANGYPPTVREIGENLGLQSSSTAFNLLEQLVKKGYVSKGPGPRMLRVIKPELRAIVNEIKEGDSHAGQGA